MCHLSNATEAQSVLPPCRGAVLMQEGRVREYAAVDERAVALPQRHLGANETQDVGCSGELAGNTNRALLSNASVAHSKLHSFSVKKELASATVCEELEKKNLYIYIYLFIH